MEQGEWMTGWMNEQVKGEIEDLRRRFGFEEQEAIVFWHIRRAEIVIAKMHNEEVEKRRESEQEEDDKLEYGEWLGRVIARSAVDSAKSQISTGQHFNALYRHLGTRVLKRDYQEGWGSDPTADVPEELLNPSGIEDEPED